MNKETDLSSQWLEAWQLRQWSKGRIAKELDEKMNNLEEEMFNQADERINEHYARKRTNQPNSESGKSSA